MWCLGDHNPRDRTGRYFTTFRTCLFERATLLPGVVLSFFILKTIQETNNVLL
nr:MAG TPA: hypothetical protein [Caudoviricetes sp.]